MANVNILFIFLFMILKAYPAAGASLPLGSLHPILADLLNAEAAIHRDTAREDAVNRVKFRIEEEILLFTETLQKQKIEAKLLSDRISETKDEQSALDHVIQELQKGNFTRTQLIKLLAA